MALEELNDPITKDLLRQLIAQQATYLQTLIEQTRTLHTIFDRQATILSSISDKLGIKPPYVLSPSSLPPLTTSYTPNIISKPPPKSTPSPKPGVPPSLPPPTQAYLTTPPNPQPTATLTSESSLLPLAKSQSIHPKIHKKRGIHSDANQLRDVILWELLSNSVTLKHKWKELSTNTGETKGERREWRPPWRPSTSPIGTEPNAAASCM